MTQLQHAVWVCTTESSRRLQAAGAWQCTNLSSNTGVSMDTAPWRLNTRVICRGAGQEQDYGLWASSVQQR